MLHHQEDGRADAPVLVLGPSLGTDLHLLDAQVDSVLAERYRIVRFDLPGHGRSPAPDGPLTVADLAAQVVALLDELGVDVAHYAGVSLGGAIGQQLAVDHPERVATLTAIATAARFADPEAWPRRAATVREQGTAAMVASRPGIWFTHAFASEQPAEARRLTDMLEATGDEGYAACSEAVGAFDIRDRLAAIVAPTLVIAGAEDPAATPEMMRVIADGVPGAGFLVVADSAHLLNAEKPAEVTAALVDHLAEHPIAA